MANVVVFDVGGTKINTSIINDRGQDLLMGSPITVETPERADAAVFVGAMAQQYRQLEEQFGDVVAWGAAFPGPYRRLENGELMVLPRNVPGMRGKSVEEEMRHELPGVLGIVDNDTKLAVWGEHLIGSLQGCRNAVGMVHGTGVSAALIVDGEMLRGPNNNAGEIGCIVSERDPQKARPCDAQDGKAYGHLESQIRGPALAEIFFGVDRHNKKAVHHALTGATDGDRNQIIEHCVPYVADALTPLLQAASTGDVVVFGGIATWLGSDYAISLSDELCRTSEAFREADKKVQIAWEPQLSPLVAAAQQAFTKVGQEMKLP